MYLLCLANCYSSVNFRSTHSECNRVGIFIKMVCVPNTDSQKYVFSSVTTFTFVTSLPAIKTKTVDCCVEKEKTFIAESPAEKAIEIIESINVVME